MKVSDLVEKIIVVISAIGFISILLSLIYYRSLDFIPFSLGVLLGSAVSILKVILLKRAVDKAVDMEEKHAGNYVSIQHFLRLIVSGLALFLGAVIPQISLWGTVVGILSFQAAVYIAGITSNK